MTDSTDRGAAAEMRPDSDVPSRTDAPRASRWEDFIDIFYAPSSVFERRATSGFLLPMVVVTLLAGALFLMNGNVMSQIMDAEFTRAMARQPQGQSLTPDQIAKMRSVSETIGKIAVFVFVPVGMFFVGLALWLSGKIVDAGETLGQAVMVAAYSSVPRLLEAVLTAVQGLLLDPASIRGRWSVSIGPARFLDPDTTSPVLLTLVGRFDVFVLWATVLLAIGLAVTGRIPRSRAALAAGIVWLLGAVPPLLQAMR
jgi:hypothetical protein